MLKVALGFAASAYAKDAVVRPKQMGRLARDYCDRVGKPLLLVRSPGFTEKLMGPPVRAEATVGHAFPIRVPDGTFGAVLVVGVLERERSPEVALREWHRVADRVFVVVPGWLSPHTWLDPTHRWVIDSQLQKAAPLWNGQQNVRLLRVSDKGYGGGRWRTKPRQTSPSPSPPPSTSRPESPPRPSPNPSSPSQFVLPSEGSPTLYETPLSPASGSETFDYRPPEQQSPRFESSNSPLDLMAVSEGDFDENW